MKQAQDACRIKQRSAIAQQQTRCMHYVRTNVHRLVTLNKTKKRFQTTPTPDREKLRRCCSATKQWGAANVTFKALRVPVRAVWQSVRETRCAAWRIISSSACRTACRAEQRCVYLTLRFFPRRLPQGNRLLLTARRLLKS